MVYGVSMDILETTINRFLLGLDYQALLDVLFMAKNSRIIDKGLISDAMSRANF